MESSRLPPPLDDLRVAQIAFLVPDLEVAVARWSRMFGLTEWYALTYSTRSVPVLRYREEPGGFSMRLALAGAGPQIELIQPLDGPSIYHEWIEEHGFGPHHVGVHVSSIEATVDAMADAGIGAIQEGYGYGVRGDGGFAYFDTLDTYGVIVEAIEVPSLRQPSETLSHAGITFTPSTGVRGR
ncbi:MULTISPECIES: VOC family protein [unclassified Streptosporangium]|uniref:VOC family protein n=1 Tax=unclassified Streptosporangium TaxID=2632669 RepID=UPI002E2E62E9|nr:MULTISPECIES: VOC family protein [unclassified Streptosporangium]